MMILNEEKYARTVYDGRNADVKSIMSKIRYVVRYLLHAKNKNDAEVYKETVEWLAKYHDNFEESCYSNVISDAINGAHKYPFYKIDSIKITHLELDIISSLNNLRAEKVLFVLLCMAKQQSVSMGFTNGLVKYSITDLCKMARISVPSDEREYILHYIVEHGFIGYPKKNDTKCLIVTFIDNESDVALELNEVDCKELAYAYLNWKNKGKGYGRCECCKRLIKQVENQTEIFCESCHNTISNIADDIKVRLCIDCDAPVYINNPKDTRTCRCDKCQKEERQRINKEYYNKNKD